MFRGPTSQKCGAVRVDDLIRRQHIVVVDKLVLIALDLRPLPCFFHSATEVKIAALSGKNG